YLGYELFGVFRRDKEDTGQVGIGLIHSHTVHGEKYRIIPAIVPVDQLHISVEPDQIVVETIGKGSSSGVSSAGKDLAHKEPGAFIFQTDIHSAFKGGAFKRDHRLGMEEKGSSFLYENRGMSACLSLFHVVDLIVGLGDKLCPGAFFYMKRKFLKISCHDSRGSSQQHDLDPAAFQGKDRKST